MTPIFYKLNANKIEINFKEAARYSGCSKNIDESDPIALKIKESCSQMQKILMPQAVYYDFPLIIEPADENSTKKIIKFADITIESKDLGSNLKGCSRIILLAATIGAQVDNLIRKTQIKSSADGAIMQGTGAMFIESFVDKLNKMIELSAEKKGQKAHPRYSPGYGDIPLELQKDFFRILPCNKIGLTLMDTLIMAPEKSVTAFIGLE